jgi:hypothetical protein
LRNHIPNIAIGTNDKNFHLRSPRFDRCIVLAPQSPFFNSTIRLFLESTENAMIPDQCKNPFFRVSNPTASRQREKVIEKLIGRAFSVLFPVLILLLLTLHQALAEDQHLDLVGHPPKYSYFAFPVKAAVARSITEKSIPSLAKLPHLRMVKVRAREFWKSAAHKTKWGLVDFVDITQGSRLPTDVFQPLH